jgi:hypothetical protein
MRRVTLGVAALVCMASPCAAQSGFVARLSADTVEVGEAFSLLVRVPVPPGSVVHFPDTVARTDFLESHAPVRWEAESDGSGGAVLTLDYPVMAFGIAVVPVPGFDVFVSPATGAAAGATLPGGSFVGAWADAPTTGPAYQRPLRVPRRGIWVNPVFTPEQVEAGNVGPMPTADVIGASWHWPSTLAVLAFAALLALALGRIVVEWRRGMPAGAARPGVGWTPETSRRHALDELARLRDEGLPAAGRTHELYTRSTGIVRTHVSRVIPAYGTDLTSTELVSRLGDEEPAVPAPNTPLTAEMHTAEVVKFGRLRPARDAAEEHLASLRAWLESWRGGA